MKTYSDLIKLKTFKERFDYLKIGGSVGERTFGSHRYVNQGFYHSPEWKRIRDIVIIRDMGCDLGIEGREIVQKIYIHHMNPIVMQDLIERSQLLLDPEYMICTSYMTHQAIHYGDESLLVLDPVERRPNDTIPWRTV